MHLNKTNKQKKSYIWGLEEILEIFSLEDVYFMNALVQNWEAEPEGKPRRQVLWLRAPKTMKMPYNKEYLFYFCYLLLVFRD